MTADKTLMSDYRGNEFIRVIKESREFKNIVTELEQRMKIKEKKVI